jgi:hypothetical protein
MSFDDSKRELIMQHFEQLQNTFSGLQLKESENGRFIVAGNLSFTASHNGKTIKDDYDIEIVIPNNYPQNPPIVKETSNKIPPDKDNHVNSKDGTLCLGAPLAVRRTFAQGRNLLWFVKEQVVQFLFSHSYKRDYGKSPSGELSHDTKGLLEYYKELFSVQDNWHVLGLLKILADNNYKGHTLCPCGSGQKLRHCHGGILMEIKEYQKPNDFLVEHLSIFKFLNESGTKQNLRECMPNAVSKSMRKHKRKPFVKRLA